MLLFSSAYNEYTVISKECTILVLQNQLTILFLPEIAWGDRTRGNYISFPFKAN